MELNSKKMTEGERMEKNEVKLCPCGRTRHYTGSVYCTSCGKKLNEKTAFPKWIISKWKGVVKELLN